MSPQFKQDSFKFFIGKRIELMKRGYSIGSSGLKRIVAVAVPTVSLAFSLAACNSTVCLAAPPASAQPGVHYTQGNFTLPFQVKPGGRSPQHLDLMISRDAGRSWQVHQTATPAEGRFRFSHAEEGNYWLKVQVRDSTSSSLSQTTMQLCIDRTQPKPAIECDWEGEQSLIIKATIDELNLDPQSVKLTLRTDISDQPVPVPLQISPALADANEFQATVDVPACKSFELRLSAVDRAGNRASHSQRYFHPVLAGEHDALLPASIDEETPIKPTDQTAREIVKNEWTAVELGAPKPIQRTQLVAADASRSVVRKLESRSDLAPQELIPPERPQELSLEPPTAPALASNVAAPEPAASPELTTAATTKTTSRKFKINYDLAQSIPGDQLNVELWVTMDQGATWEFWGLDRDSQSPAWIEVDRDGEYGFCVVCVHTQADLQYRPSAGDKPDLCVTVKEPPARRRLQAVSATDTLRVK